MLSNLGSLAMLATMMAACAQAAPAQQQSAKQPASAAHSGQSAAPATKSESPQQLLAKRAGEYIHTVRFVGGQGSQAEPSKGTSKISAILGGRFLLEEFNDVVFGQSVSGTRLYGYNNATGEYEAAFTYTMSPAILMLKGASKDGGRTVDYAGESSGPNGSSIMLHVRVRQVDDDEIVMSFSMTGPDGKPTTFQETTYTRKR